MLTKKQVPSRVLIFKNKSGAGIRVAAQLHRVAKSQHFEIAIAVDTAKLRQMLENETFSAVIIDLGREIGNTLTALRILGGFPAIPVFIFNGFLLPRIEEKAKEYSQVHYFENYNDLDNSFSLILAAIKRKYSAVVQGISLPQFLQLMSIEKWSGRVMVTAGNNHGVLFLQQGRLISTATGELTGQEAWEKMAAWEKINVETMADQLPANLPVSKIQEAALEIKQPGAYPTRKKTEPAGAGNIETLHLVRQNLRIALNLKKLSLALAHIREILSTSLLRTDIFLSHNNLSLAGWNSSPLACSQFAAITRSLINSLQISGFPPLGDYYLLDLDADQLIFIVVKDELQWGFLLKGTKERLGLLLNVILPKALEILADAVSTQRIV